jgi:hypothetical protein
MENDREEHMGKVEIVETQVEHQGSWKEGSCCCNCRNLSVLRKHPWNTSPFAKGPTEEKIGYVCTWGTEDRIATFMDSAHGMCEMHWPTQKREKYLEVKKTAKKFNV